MGPLIRQETVLGKSNKELQNPNLFAMQLIKYTLMEMMNSGRHTKEIMVEAPLKYFYHLTLIVLASGKDEEEGFELRST